MFRSVYQSVKKNMTVLLLLLPAVLVCLPVVLIITGSVMDSIELKQYLYPVFGIGLFGRQRLHVARGLYHG